METEQVQCVYVCVCVCIVCVTRPGHGDPGQWRRHHHRAPAGSLSNNPYLLESTNGLGILALARDTVSIQL